MKERFSKGILTLVGCCAMIVIVLSACGTFTNTNPLKANAIVALLNLEVDSNSDEQLTHVGLANQTHCQLIYSYSPAIFTLTGSWRIELSMEQGGTFELYTDDPRQAEAYPQTTATPFINVIESHILWRLVIPIEGDAHLSGGKVRHIAIFSPQASSAIFQQNVGDCMAPPTPTPTISPTPTQRGPSSQPG